MKLNKQANEITINGEIYSLSDIEFIGTQNMYYVAVYGKNGEICHPSKNSVKDFTEIATILQSEGIDNFVWLSGNILVNVNKIKKVSYNASHVTIKTNNYTHTVNNACGAEALYLLEKCQHQKNKSQEEIER